MKKEKPKTRMQRIFGEVDDFAHSRNASISMDEAHLEADIRIQRHDDSILAAAIHNEKRLENKKFSVAVLAAILLSTPFFAASEWYEECTGRTWSYTVTDGCATITGVSPAGGDVVIPGEINGVSVTRIGDYAFDCCFDLKTVSFSANLQDIGTGAFYGCHNWSAEWNLPGTVTNIAGHPFCSDDPENTARTGSSA